MAAAGVMDLTEDRRDLLMVSTWLWTSIAAAFVAGRYYCRIRLMRSVWWDDWMILVSVVCLHFPDHGVKVESLLAYGLTRD
jgi:hypothetical protein